MQHDRSRHLGAIAVVRTDRFGEPGELTTGSGTKGHEGTVVERRGLADERSVVLTCACRSGGPVDRDVDLVDGGELRTSDVGRSARPDPATSRHRRRAMHRIESARSASHIIASTSADLVADRDHADPAVEQRDAVGVVRAGVRQHGNDHIVEERARRQIDPTGVDVDEGSTATQRRRCLATRRPTTPLPMTAIRPTSSVTVGQFQRLPSTVLGWCSTRAA